MINRETLLKKIESLPPYLLEELDEYIDFIQFKKVNNNNFTEG